MLYYQVNLKYFNYAKYFADGDVKASGFEDYHSHNTKRLTFEETKTLLLKQKNM